MHSKFVLGGIHRISELLVLEARTVYSNVVFSGKCTGSLLWVEFHRIPELLVLETMTVCFDNINLLFVNCF